MLFVGKGTLLPQIQIFIILVVFLLGPFLREVSVSGKKETKLNEEVRGFIVFVIILL